jgi:transposase
MTSLYAGLDVADKTTSLCVLEPPRRILFETKIATDAKLIAAALKPYRRRLRQVGQESGTKSNWLHKELQRRRLPIVTLDAFHTKKALSASSNKTDKNDARGIATLMASSLYTPSYVKSEEAMRIRLLLITRKALQRKAIDLQSMLRMICKTFGLRLDAKRGRVRAIDSRRSIDPHLSQLCLTTLKASQILLAEVSKLDKVVAQVAQNDAICRRLMTAPGVGPLTSLAFRAGVDDPARFKRSRDVGAYFGLAPRTFQSGESQVTGRITQRGDTFVRHSLFLAASVLLTVSRSQCRLRLWGLRIRRRKGFGVAVVAVARKLAVIAQNVGDKSRFRFGSCKAAKVRQRSFLLRSQRVWA